MVTVINGRDGGSNDNGAARVPTNYRSNRDKDCNMGSGKSLDGDTNECLY